MISLSQHLGKDFWILSGVKGNYEIFEAKFV
jgi:hypothetical protein